jgi:hypothetical protein
VEQLKDIVQHPLFGILSFLGTILGVILAIIFYRVSKREKKPYWSIGSNNLIEGFSSQVPGLEISYNNQKVENLTVSKIVFWNDGKETIHGTDIAEADPLQIIARGNVKILDIKVLKTNSEPSRFCNPDDSELQSSFVTFDFLDKNQGGIIQVIHTGTSSMDISLKGTLKGAGVPKYYDPKGFKRATISSLVLVGGFMLCTALLLLFLKSLEIKDPVASLLMFFMMLLFGYAVYKSVSFTKVPKDLNT